MRTATTIGFAIEEADRGRLDHLSQVFGGGNRSAFLRRAIEVMERLEVAEELGRLQAYGAQRLAESGQSISDIPEIVEKALSSEDPQAVAQAKLIVADLVRRVPTAPGAVDTEDKLKVAFGEALEEMERN